MANSKTIVLGPAKIEMTEVTDNTVTAADKKKLVAITLFDCFPPPGSTAEFVRPASFSPDVLKRFLQSSETADLRAVHKSIGGSPTTDDAILAEISNRLDLVDMPINYVGDKYNKMRRITKCYKTTLYIAVEYKVFQIKITANRDITIPGKTFPAGDEIATYRVRQPNRYRFETYHEFNRRCCEEKPEIGPDNETTSWYTPFHSILDEFEFKLPKKFEFRFRPDYDFDFDYRRRFRIELKYKW